jgi:hypothetical protein
MQIEIRECLLSFDAESSVFQSAIQKCQDQDIQNHNLSLYFVYVWNLVTHIEGGKQAEGFRE